MKKHYSIIKYHGYIIEGCGTHYELYHPLGLVGEFTTCKQAKAYVDRERADAIKRWNDAVLEEERMLKGEY